MSTENGQLLDIKKLFEQIEDLRKEANKKTENYAQIQKDFKILLTQLHNLEKSHNEYANAFAYLYRLTSNQNKYDRNLELDKDNALLFFLKNIKTLHTELEEGRIDLQDKYKQLAEEKEKFEQEKTDREKLYAEWKKEDLAKIESENTPLRKQIIDKEVELAKLLKDIDTKKNELEALHHEIEDTGKTITHGPIDGNTRPTTEVAVLKDFTDAGFAAPEGAVPGHLYLCGEFGYVDVTVMPNVNRIQLQNIDSEKFKYTGKPQISFVRLSSGDWNVRPQPNLTNKVNGKELTEEILLPQGAIIEMTDKRRKTHLVKVFIAL